MPAARWRIEQRALPHNGGLPLAALAALATGWTAEPPEKVFADEIRPAMEHFCGDCHQPGKSKGGVRLLEAESAADIQRFRGVWRSAAAQLRNRTMPPARKEQPGDTERARLVAWIEGLLRDTACDAGPYAGWTPPRRLNRLEYDRTVRDLFGVDLGFDETLPADGGAGEGFANNAESLFLPPMLLERYMEAAGRVVDAAIVSPPVTQVVEAAALRPLAARGELRAGRPLTALVDTYIDAAYRVDFEGRVPEGMRLVLEVDGVVVRRFRSPGRHFGAELRLARGTHALTVKPTGGDAEMTGDLKRVSLRRIEVEPPDDAAIARHRRLCGVDPGQAPVGGEARALAEQRLRELLPLAFRRPVEDEQVARYLRLAERALARGDPYEEALKLALRGVLVSDDFLFRVEAPPPEDAEGPQPLDDHELATRLSYFLWCTTPDEQLRERAAAGALRDEDALRAEIDRMLGDERARVFAEDFVGQWLGTKDVGGRVAPTANDVQKFYTPEIAADMRREAVEYFAHLLREDRSLLELVDSDYTFLTGRLAKFYELPMAGELPMDRFRRVTLPDRRRGGVLGMGAVLGADLAPQTHQRRAARSLGLRHAHRRAGAAAARQCPAAVQVRRQEPLRTRGPAPPPRPRELQGLPPHHRPHRPRPAELRLGRGAGATGTRAGPSTPAGRCRAERPSTARRT